MESDLDLVIDFCRLMEKEGERNFPPDENYLRGMKLSTKHIINYCQQLMALRLSRAITPKKGEDDGQHNEIDRYDLA